VVVIFDSDFLVTGSLEESLVEAANGRICAYPDPKHDRFFSEWERLFKLARPPRRQTYVTSSFVAFSADRWPDLLRRFHESCELVPAGRTLAHGAGYEDPMSLGDQDALNAVLMSEVPPDALLVLPRDERPVWHNEWVRVVDTEHLICSYDGTPTKILHADGIQKPWERAAWWRIEKDAYVVLMRRLLRDDELDLSVEPRDLPIWLRPGLTGRLVLEVMHAVHRLVTTVVRRWPIRIVKPWLIAQLERRRSLARRALERRQPPVTRDG
jgi:hypothetical protein